MELTNDQKQTVREKFKSTPDLKLLTQLVFDNPTLDGRSKEGRAIRKFLKNESLVYSTTQIEPAASVVLTPQQKEFLMSPNIESGMKPLEIARLTFQDPNIASLSAHHRVILDFLKDHRPDVLEEDDILAKGKWKPPTSFTKALKKINDWTGKNFDEFKMTVRERKNCEALLIHLNSPRILNIINNYKLETDRELFEGEFVRSVWDKPDLTIDELNLYINVCANYVRQKHVQKRLDSLNDFFNQTNDPNQSMRFTELIKTTSEELNQIEKRIESLINKLNGDRAKRKEREGANNASILSLVEAFQNYEERERMVKMANMELELASKEVDRLESMDEMKARILGISRRELE